MQFGSPLVWMRFSYFRDLHSDLCTNVSQENKHTHTPQELEIASKLQNVRTDSMCLRKWMLGRKEYVG